MKRRADRGEERGTQGGGQSLDPIGPPALGHHKELGFYSDYRRTPEVNEVLHVTIGTAPGTCAGPPKY